MKNEKYCAAVASVSWLTDAAYPLRVHTAFLRFPNFELSQKSRLGLLSKLCGVALIKIIIFILRRTASKIKGEILDIKRNLFDKKQPVAAFRAIGCFKLWDDTFDKPL